MEEAWRKIMDKSKQQHGRNVVNLIDYFCEMDWRLQEPQKFEDVIFISHKKSYRFKVKPLFSRESFQGHIIVGFSVYTIDLSKSASLGVRILRYVGPENKFTKKLQSQYTEFLKDYGERRENKVAEIIERFENE